MAAGNDGAARLVVPLRDRRPTSLGVRLEIPDRPEHLVRIAVNGQTLFEVEDQTFAEAGMVGLWTKADSVTLFDAITYGLSE